MIRFMPIIKSAKKKLKQDKYRTAVNKVYRSKLRLALKQAKLIKTKKAVNEAYRAIDRAAKKNIIHKNKAARLKSRLIKLVKSKSKKKSSK